MRRNLLIICLSLFTLLLANDGSYYTSGNQLIPIFESNVEIQKEILTITRINTHEVKVEVDYTFYNSRKEKQIVVGFEAPSPQGDVDGTPVNGAHPYIKNFIVEVNGTSTSYKTAIVTDSNYTHKGSILSTPVEEIVNEDFEPNFPNFYYVYYFDALFPQGKTKIKHEYIFELSGSVMIAWEFDYILTAATRWANNQIDDFTLIIDMGHFEDHYIDRTFFQNIDEWDIKGKAIVGESMNQSDQNLPPMRVFTTDKPLIYKKKNFKPKGELSVYETINMEALEIESFDALRHQLPYNMYEFISIHQYVDERSYKILRNLPYARRGYVFQTDFIQTYYEDMPWYTPNPNYKAEPTELTQEERDWLDELKLSKP